MSRWISIIFFLALSSTAWGAPSISGVSGTVDHGESVTITGTGFGTKSTAAPIVWDNCSGEDPLALWDGNYNSLSGDDYVGNYRTPAQVGRGVSTAHAHVSKYFCGAHYPATGPTDGRNIGLIKRRVISIPAYTYAYWYERTDPLWSWDLSDTDNNYKMYAYSTGDMPYSGSTYHYFEKISATAGDGYDFHEVITPQNIWAAGWADLASGWHKFEIEFRIDNTPSGYVKVWVDGVLKINASFTSDNWDGTSRNDMIGGYVRDNGATTQWRYFNDLYIDYTPQRVMIGNANTLAGCTTLREVQIPSAWSDTEITCTVNQGGFEDESTAYLYVFDAAGASNETGYPVTFGKTPRARWNASGTVRINASN